jgi:hypothetical protein
MADRDVAENNAPDGQRPHAGRRRLLQGGLAAAPLMTLVSRPVLGGVSCQTPSVGGSMPNSAGHLHPECSGGSPIFWSQQQNFGQWPSPYYPITVGGPNGRGASATPFSPRFSPSPYPPETTFLTVLKEGGSSNNSVAGHLVAARLNVAKGWTPVLDESRIQTIWLEYTSKGYFEPTAGVKWYQPEIVAYLESLETK